jgi:3-mercaptopyruvate sulfurtransferase SseA
MKHHCKYVSKRLALLLMVLFVGTLTLTGCGSGGGSDDYDSAEAPAETSNYDYKTQASQDSDVMIDAPQLKAWIDQGLVNNSDSYKNVVILHYGDDDYATGHIPGAQPWSVRGIERVEGPVLSGNMVLDGESMDILLQERGIHEGSTIVFAGGGGNTARLYFLFRYWGFPRSSLKILNGDEAAWKAYGYQMTTVVPTVAETDFSVKDIPSMNNFDGFGDNLRASLSEAIQNVSAGTVTPYNTYAATTGATNPDVKETIRDSEGYVTFEGLMDGAVTDNFVSNLKTTETINGADVEVFKGVDAMRVALETTLGIDLSKPIMTYCRAGNLASWGFTPIDAVLGNPALGENKVHAMTYDGSWSQWGSLTNYTDVPSPEFALPEGYEAWATDVLTEDDTIVYNHIEVLGDGDDDTFMSVPEFHEAPKLPSDPDANNIEDEDYDYMYSPRETDESTGSVSGGGGGC